MPLSRRSFKALRAAGKSLLCDRLRTTSAWDYASTIKSILDAVAIQALTDDLVTFRLTVEQDIENARAEREELRQATIGIANLLSSLDSDRPTILRKLNTVENKVDLLLQQKNGDRPQPQP